MKLEEVNTAYWCLKIFTHVDVMATLLIIKENPGRTVTELNRLAWHDHRYESNSRPIEHHLMDLNKYGYIRFDKDGKWRKYFIRMDRITQVRKAIHNFTYSMSDDICRNAPLKIVTL